MSFAREDAFELTGTYDEEKTVMKLLPNEAKKLRCPFISKDFRTNCEADRCMAWSWDTNVPNEQIQMSESVTMLEVSDRILHAFKNDDIKTIADLCSRTERELLRIPNFGRRSLLETKEALKIFGEYTIGSQSVPRREGWCRLI